MSDHVLVVGASGVVGSAALAHFAARGDCEVTAVSRRPPLELAGARFRSVDLGDADACATLADEHRDVTRIVYAALFEKPGLVAGWFDPDQIERNRRMFANLLDPFADAPALRHVTLLQGTKAYGAHAGALDVPAREDRSERRDVPNFYWEQEDHLRAAADRAGWHWSILRPQIVFGASVGAAMNLIPALGVYAALRRERGEPLAYPGGVGAVLEAVDADLLARAIDWAGASAAARDEIFNVTNGDVFVWPGVWPAIAEALGMEPGPDEPQHLGESMPKRAAEWDAVRARHALRAPELAAFVGESFHYADFCMATGSRSPLPPALVSTVKLRAAGFTDVIDTEAMFRKWFERLQRARLLPPR